MRLFAVVLGLVVVAGIAAAQDEEKTKPVTKKAAPKSKPIDDSLELPAEESPLGKKAGDAKEIISRGSYAMGMLIGKNLKQSGMTPDFKRLTKGLQDILEEKDPELSDQELQAALQAMEPIVRKAAADRAKGAGDKNLKAGEAFLAANKEKQGIKTTDSGLQYKVLASGKGRSPKKSESVKAHYRGTLIDGKVFDSSYKGDAPTKKDEPAEFPVSKVIPGWTEALQKMKVGDKWQLFIPSELAYGAEQRGPTIGPNSVLIFDIELIEIVE